MSKRLKISNSITLAENNISKIKTVHKWSKMMGFNKQRKFSNKFREEYKIRPIKALIHIRLIRILKLLRKEENSSCFEIALKTGLKDEKSLYNFLSRNINMGPRAFRQLDKNKQISLLEELKRTIKEV